MGAPEPDFSSFEKRRTGGGGRPVFPAWRRGMGIDQSGLPGGNAEAEKSPGREHDYSAVGQEFISLAVQDLFPESAGNSPGLSIGKSSYQESDFRNLSQCD